MVSNIIRDGGPWNSVIAIKLEILLVFSLLLPDYDILDLLLHSLIVEARQCSHL